MIISEVSRGQKAPYSVSGTELTVGTVKIDLQQRQRSVQNVIDICLDNQLQTMREGLGAWYVATIVIPPRKWKMVSTGEADEEGNEVMVEEELPLDMSSVQLRLWGLPQEYDADAVIGDDKEDDKNDEDGQEEDQEGAEE
jgi:hypothetical protein